MEVGLVNQLILLVATYQITLHSKFTFGVEAVD
jgi:hypothetical protein